MKRSSKLGLLEAKQEFENRAGVGVTLRLPFAGVHPYLQSQQYLYLWDWCRVLPNTVSYKQIVGAQWVPVVITETIWMDKAEGSG